MQRMGKSNQQCKIYVDTGVSGDWYICDYYKLRGGCLKMYWVHPNEGKTVKIIPLNNPKISLIVIEVCFLKERDVHAVENK